MIIAQPRALRTLYYDFVGGTVTFNGGTPRTSMGGKHIHKVLGSPVFDATDGLGISTASSIVCLAQCDFPNVRVTATMLYRTDLSSANRFGVVLRAGGWHDTGSRDYIYVQVNAGVAQIAEATDDVIGGVLGSAAFAVAEGVETTIVAELNGTALTTSFSASGVATVTPSATVTITDPGGIGFRSGPSKRGWCRNLLIEEL